MGEKALIRRQIHLKRQALQLIREEILELRLRLSLLILQQRLESQMTNDFEPQLSRKLESLSVLLEN